MLALRREPRNSFVGTLLAWRVGMAQVRVVPVESTAPTAWLERLARAGYAVKGVTYMLLAFIAMRAALGDGRAENTSGALREFKGPAAGDIVILLIALGLFAYAVWKLYFALVNPEREKIAKRAGAAFTALINGGLALEAARLGLSAVRGTGSGDQAVHWSAVVMGHPAGPLLVGAVGIGVAAFGATRIGKAAKSKLDEQLRLRRIEARTRKTIITAARVGIAARGVVFMLVGAFLVRAAARANPADAKDFGHSLQELKNAPLGEGLLVAVAAGLFLYGIYELVRARYRRFVT